MWVLAGIYMVFKCHCGQFVKDKHLGVHMHALWCQACCPGRFWSAWPIADLPWEVRLHIFGMLDLVSGTRCKRASWQCLRTPLAEGSRSPTSRFMSRNRLAMPAAGPDLNVTIRSLSFGSLPPGPRL